MEKYRELFLSLSSHGCGAVSSALLKQDIHHPVGTGRVNIYDLLAILAVPFQTSGHNLFLDEFQNIAKVNPGFLSDFQRLLDSHPDTRVVISGSIMSMTKKLLEEYGSPVYGRFDTVIRLRELPFRESLSRATDLRVATDDGSAGHHGFVTDLLDRLHPRDFDTICVCGPEPMMYRVLRMLESEGIPERGQFSLHRYMKCGIGKCGRCNVGPYYVCKDGPVFTAAQIDALPADM
jgi:hypothetical protein